MTIDIPSALAKVRELNSKRTPGEWVWRQRHAEIIGYIHEMVDLIEAMAAEREWRPIESAPELRQGRVRFRRCRTRPCRFDDPHQSTH